MNERDAMNLSPLTKPVRFQVGPRLPQRCDLCWPCRVCGTEVYRPFYGEARREVDDDGDHTEVRCRFAALWRARRRAGGGDGGPR